MIDPTVTYATYFGGGGADYGDGIAVDASGNAFVTGSTDSAAIPGNTGAQSSLMHSSQRLTPAADSSSPPLRRECERRFSSGIAIDSTAIYVAGTTDSSDFPASLGAAPDNFPRWSLDWKQRCLCRET